MRILEFRSQCSDVLHAVIEAMRGDVDRCDFLMHALAVGLGHLQEEVLNQHRQRTYEKLTIGTNQFGDAVALYKLSTPAATPTVPASFGCDITRPKAVG